MERPGRTGIVADAVLGVVVGVSGVPSYWHQPLIVVTQLLMGAAISIRRFVPLTGCVLVSVCFVSQAVFARAPEDQVSLIAVPLLAYTVAAYRPRLIALAGLGVLVAAVCWEVSVATGEYLFSTGIVLVGWIPGSFMFGRRLEVRRLEDVTRRLVDEREEQDAAAAGRERARLARELHDVVSHSVGAMMIQAAAAEQVFDSAPLAARAALGQVQRTGAQAMTELHRLLGLLRDDQASSEQRTPQPDLSTIDALVADTQAEGVNDIDYRICGVPLPVSPALELSAYRIVQEALTNARKHAAGTAVTIWISWPPVVAQQQMHIDVRNSQGSPQRPRIGRASSSGNGLIGIRERAALFGGDVTAGPRPGGGFRLLVVLSTAAGSVLAGRS